MKYTPKHSTARRPRGRRMTTVVLAGAASAAALGMTAPAASANSVWDDVAACESSGNWSINTGNGFYGGLQFHPDTWSGFGGDQYAPQAHQATKAQQIEIAQKVLAVQGPGAWPKCSQVAGLTAANGGASSGGGSTQESTESSSSAEASSSEREESSSRSQERQEEPAETESAPAPEASSEPAPAPQPSAGWEYTVKSGDRVSLLAEQYGTSVSAIASASGLADAGSIMVGQTLIIPGEQPSSSSSQSSTDDYTIVSGDTVGTIADEHGVSISAIVDANGLDDPDFIIAGETLEIPAS